MNRIVPTVAQMQTAIGLWSLRVAAALIATGAALSFSVIFIGPGVVLLALGVAEGLAGWTVRFLMPWAFPHRRVVCANCQRSNSVLVVFRLPDLLRCDGCSTFMPVEVMEMRKMVIDEPIVYVLARKMLMVFAAFSFAMLFIEVYLGHFIRFEIFLQTFKWSPSMIPNLFSPIAMIIALVTALWPTPNTVRVFNGTMLTSILIAALGAYFHISARFTSPGDLLSVAVWLGNPPALAPFAYAMPGIMGLVATFALRWASMVPREAVSAPGTASSGSAVASGVGQG